MYRRLLKALHALGAIGFVRGLAACLVLVANTAAAQQHDACRVIRRRG